jgi:hypothetical protein
MLGLAIQNNFCNSICHWRHSVVVFRARERPPKMGAASVLPQKLAGVLIEELQSLLIELGRALINGRVRAGLENNKLATLYSAS